MLRKVIVSAVLISIVLGVSLAAAGWLVRTAPKPTQSAPVRPVLTVRSVELRPTAVTETVTGFGTARAKRRSTLAAEVPGDIIALPEELRVGSPVTKGQVLLRINDAEYQQQLARAQSLLAAEQAQLEQLDVEKANVARLLKTAQRELQSTEWEHNKVHDLYQRGAAPKREYEKARLALEQTRRSIQVLENQQKLIPTRRAALQASVANREAELAIARLNVERCTIRAPFAARIEDRPIDLGEYVQKGSSLITLLNPDLIEVAIELPLSARPRVTTDAPCTLDVPSMPDVTWQGTIKRIAPSARETTRTFAAFVEVDNRAHKHTLMPGYFVRARIEGPTLTDVLVIPRGTVQRGRVYVYQDGQARPREVRIVRDLKDRSIIAGLEPGQFVITSNLDALYDGLPVRLEETLADESSDRPEPRATDDRARIARRGDDSENTGH